ncbi:hypothetical protein WDU94_000549 [Cyamophila willieti]
MRGQIKMFADDTCIISVHRNLEQAIENAQADFINLQKYYYNNSIFLNDKKTEAILFGHRRNLQINDVQKIYCHKRKCLEEESYTNLTCNCQQIEYTDKVKYLGINIDRDFKMRDHTTTTCKKLRIIYYNMRKIEADKIPLSSRKMLYFALVESVLRYGCTVYTVAPQTALQPLNSIQNKIKNFLFNPINRSQLMSAEQLAILQLIYENFSNEEYRQVADHGYSTRHQRFKRTIPNNKYGERKRSYKIPKLLDEYCRDFISEENHYLLKDKIKTSILDKN